MRMAGDTTMAKPWRFRLHINSRKFLMTSKWSEWPSTIVDGQCGTCFFFSFLVKVLPINSNTFLSGRYIFRLEAFRSLKIRTPRSFSTWTSPKCIALHFSTMNFLSHFSPTSHTICPSHFQSVWNHSRIILLYIFVSSVDLENLVLWPNSR